MNDDILLRRINDIFSLCDKYHTPKFSHFLDEREQTVISNEMPYAFMFGGYDGAERRIIGAFPDWIEPGAAEFPIKLLTFKKRYDKPLSHRHYLGTILSLGIDRDRVGDILADDNGAYVFVCEDIAGFIKDGISKIAGVGVEIEISDCGEIKIPEKKFAEMNVICASMRLDAVVAAALNKSRNEAKAIILSGKAAVNHIDTVGVDYILKEGDLLSITGFGRVRISVIGGKTRSDRLHITLKKYL